MRKPPTTFTVCKEGVRIGTMDLKIASICLANDATLLTRNLVDFDKVPDCERKTGSTNESPCEMLNVKS